VALRPEEYERAADAVGCLPQGELYSGRIARIALDASGVAERIAELEAELAELKAALPEVTRMGPRALLAYRRARRR
jgi:hypothetical protein